MEEEKKKSILEGLGIEAVFIGIVILVILGVLSYLNIIPVGKITSPLISWISQSLQGSKEDRLKKLYQLPKEPTIRVTSDIAGYEVSLRNEKDLIEFINQWNIFNKNHNIPGLGSTQGVPLKLIIVHLTNKDQHFNSYGNTNQIYSSSSMVILSGTFDIYIYISADILTNNKISAAGRGGYFLTGFIATLYNFDLNSVSGGAKDDNKLTQIFHTLANKKEQFFLINKK